MKFKSIFTLLVALSFALALALPAFADTGPPAPKTNCLKKEVKKSVTNVNHFVSDIAVTAITIEASRDVGTHVVVTAESNTDQWQMEKPDNRLYLDRPERPAAAYCSYVVPRLQKVTLNKLRPPALE